MKYNYIPNCSCLYKNNGKIYQWNDACIFHFRSFVIYLLLIETFSTADCCFFSWNLNIWKLKGRCTQNLQQFFFGFLHVFHCHCHQIEWNPTLPMFGIYFSLIIFGSGFVDKYVFFCTKFECVKMSAFQMISIKTYVSGVRMYNSKQIIPSFLFDLCICACYRAQQMRERKVYKYALEIIWME